MSNTQVPRPTVAGRLCDWVTRRRTMLMWLFIGHVVLAHYLWLGFTAWDGFTYRVPPLVELVQHGALNGHKYSFWAVRAFLPFLEFVNVPFLYLFGLTGLYLSSSLVLLPICITGVHLFGRELLGDRRFGVFTAACYALIPMVNGQIMSGNTDFAVSGMLAWFLFALLRLRRCDRWSAYALFALTTWTFTMARQQAPYLAIGFFVVIGCGCIFMRQAGLRFHLERGPQALKAAGALLVGIAPAAVIQIVRAVKYGNPIYPYEFSVLGVQIGKKFEESYRVSCLHQGMSEYSLRGFLGAFKNGWLWPSKWPAGFWDSRLLGGGLFLLTSLAVLPFVWRKINRTTWVVLATFLLASLAVRDFWLPRYSYGIVLSVSLVTGAGLLALAESAKKSLLFWPLALVVLAHAARPEWEAFLPPRNQVLPRADLADSRHFKPGTGNFDIIPDMNAKIVVVDVEWGFVLRLYGRRLSNTIVGYVPEDARGHTCEWLARFPKDTVFFDDGKTSEACSRTCVWPTTGRCRIFRLDPPGNPGPQPQS